MRRDPELYSRATHGHATSLEAPTGRLVVTKRWRLHHFRGCSKNQKGTPPPTNSSHGQGCTPFGVEGVECGDYVDSQHNAHKATKALDDRSTAIHHVHRNRPRRSMGGVLSRLRSCRTGRVIRRSSPLPRQGHPHVCGTGFGVAGTCSIAIAQSKSTVFGAFDVGMAIVLADCLRQNPWE